MPANTYGRQVVQALTNKSGGSVAAGDVVIIDTANDTAFTTTTTGQTTKSIGIAQETIANNATGRVLTAGYAALVNVPASVTRGHYIETHTVAKQATGNSTRRAGSFGQFLTGGTTPTGWIWAAPDTTTSGGAVATDSIWDAAGDLAVGTGADTAAKLAIGASGTVLTSNGTTATWSTATDPAGFTTIVSSADEDATNVSGATQDHTSLQFSTVAGKHYMTEWHLMVSGSDTSGDFAFRFAVAAGTMDGRSSLTVNDSSLAAAVSSHAASAAANTGSITIGTPADAAYPTAVRLAYDFKASNTTTFKLQFGNAVAGVGRISRVFKGSYVKWKQTD